jgi:nucleoside-diphosphate-sugar epimerase
METHRANVDATLNVLVASRDAGREAGGVCRIVEVSTANRRRCRSARHAHVTADALRAPQADRRAVLSDVHQVVRLETVTTRYFNVFGPRQQPGSPYSGVISLFIEALAAGKAPHVHG